MKTLAEGIYAVALTLWIGGLWAIGYIVAPTLFSTLADRALAGNLAGKLFTLIAYVGIGCASYLLMFRLMRFGGACFKHGIFWIVLVMLGLTLAGEFGVQPILASLKNQALPKEVVESVFRDRFAAWHGVASVLYLIVSGLGVLLVWLQGRGPR
ncbi:MAG TPA: DUF4149 domain-containing protein [Burkholderiales bacterium]|nr:DUF4149 domain-containing protein [Burkholderiales bacterium]